MRSLLPALTVSIAIGPGCKSLYVLRSAYFQAELLASRRPVDDVVSTEALTDQERSSLATIADVKAWGAGIGLSSTHNYETIAWGWERTIWNVTACAPLAFQPKQWWFPVVGRVPYLGFFRERDARRVERRQLSAGRDVYVRTAGAYSTLGWFKDPVLRPMLQWTELELADTVLHELAHATLWVKGSVDFNESFASFVGEEASLRWLADRRGADSPELVEAGARLSDLTTWRSLQKSLTDELDAVYTDPSLSESEKALLKAGLFGSVPKRAHTAGFHDTITFVSAAERGPWNNARLVQFATYNDARDELSVVFARNDRDIVSFIDEVKRLTEGGGDPFQALAAAAAVP